MPNLTKDTRMAISVTYNKGDGTADFQSGVIYDSTWEWPSGKMHITCYSICVLSGEVDPGTTRNLFQLSAAYNSYAKTAIYFKQMSDGTLNYILQSYAKVSAATTYDTVSGNQTLNWGDRIYVVQTLQLVHLDDPINTYKISLGIYVYDDPECSNLLYSVLQEGKDYPTHADYTTYAPSSYSVGWYVYRSTWADSGTVRFLFGPTTYNYYKGFLAYNYHKQVDFRKGFLASEFMHSNYFTETGHTYSHLQWDDAILMDYLFDQLEATIGELTHTDGTLPGQYETSGLVIDTTEIVNTINSHAPTINKVNWTGGLIVETGEDIVNTIINAIKVIANTNKIMTKILLQNIEPIVNMTISAIKVWIDNGTNRTNFLTWFIAFVTDFIEHANFGNIVDSTFSTGFDILGGKKSVIGGYGNDVLTLLTNHSMTTDNHNDMDLMLSTIIDYVGDILVKYLEGSSFGV